MMSLAKFPSSMYALATQTRVEAASVLEGLLLLDFFSMLDYDE